MVDGRPTERILADGPGAIIVVLLEDGSCRVVDFLEQLADERPKEFAGIQALLNRIRAVGPHNIKNTDRVKPLSDGLHEFKAHQIRLIWVYGPTGGNWRRVILLDGLVMTNNRYHVGDLRYARELKSRYEKGNNNEL